MLLFLLAIAVLPAAGLGAPYPGAVLDVPVKQEQCTTSYRFTTAAPIAKVAAFYRAEGAGAGVSLVDDTAAKFPDFRIILFAQQPRVLSVVLGLHEGKIVGRVFFHTRAC